MPFEACNSTSGWLTPRQAQARSWGWDWQMGHGRGEPSALCKDLRHTYPRYGNTLLSTCSRRKTRYSMSLASVMMKEGRMPPPRASPDTSFAKQRQVPADRQALRTAPSARQCNQAVQHRRASFGWSPTATWRFSSRWLCVWLVFGAWQSRPFGETKKWKLSPWERRRKFHLPSQIVKSRAFTPNLCLDRVVSSVLETRNIEDSKRQVHVQTGE